MKIGSMLGFVGKIVGSTISALLDQIFSAIGWALYNVWRMLAYIVVVLEDIFRILAGITNTQPKVEVNGNVNTVDTNKTNIASLLIRSETVQKIFRPCCNFDNSAFIICNITNNP